MTQQEVVRTCLLISNGSTVVEILLMCSEEMAEYTYDITVCILLENADINFHPRDLLGDANGKSNISAEERRR